jgi:TolB-like protein
MPGDSMRHESVDKGAGFPSEAPTPPMARTLARFAFFFAEVQRRRVGRVAIAYAAIAFVLLQLGEIVLPAFGAPEWALRVLVVSTFMGFPPAMVLAWIFDLTSEGIRRTGHMPREDGFAGEAAGDQSSPGVPDGTNVASYVDTLASGSHMAPPSHDRLVPRAVLLAITALTVATLGWWMFQGSGGGVASASDRGGSPSVSLSPAGGTAAVPEVRSLAVLPLEDFSQEDGGEHFTAAMHEELVTQLSRLGGVRVLSRTSVAQFDGTGKTLPVIAEELGVDAVLEGSVFRAGERVRISVQLIHGSSDRHLWAGSYEGTLEDAIALQGEVAEAVAQEIQTSLFPGEELYPGRVRLAANPEAHEAFLKGRFHQARATPEALRTAEDHYQEAVEKDSGFAPAYAGLAATRFLMRLEGPSPPLAAGEGPDPPLAAGDGPGRSDSSSGVPPSPVAPSPGVLDEGVTEPLRRALVLDRELPEVQALLAAIREHLAASDISALPEEVRVQVERAGSLESELVLTGTEFGRQFQRVAMERGRGPGPGGTEAARFAGVQRLQIAGDVDRALKVLQQIVQEPGAPPQAWEALEQIRTLQGDFAGALDVRRERVARANPSPEDLASLGRLELLLEMEGERGYWVWRLGELEARKAKGEAASRVESARARLALGRREEALADLREAIDLEERALLTLWSDPAWDPLRADPAFREIQEKIRRGGAGPRGDLRRP